MSIKSPHCKYQSTTALFFCYFVITGFILAFMVCVHARVCMGVYEYLMCLYDGSFPAILLFYSFFVTVHTKMVLYTTLLKYFKSVVLVLTWECIAFIEC